MGGCAGCVKASLGGGGGSQLNMKSDQVRYIHFPTYERYEEFNFRHYRIYFIKKLLNK